MPRLEVRLVALLGLTAALAPLLPLPARAADPTPAVQPTATFVALFEGYAAGGENAALRAVAGELLPRLREHRAALDRLK